MRWERVRQQVSLGGSASGLGKRWGHTCNAIKGGSFLYVFGGYDKDNCHTNQVHVFDTEKKIWTQPVISGTPPSPRDSHSCTTVGDNLYVFGGTNGRVTFNDLHILDTSSHTWKCPNVRGELPEARECHSAAVVGTRLYIFGGCRKPSDSNDQIHFNDLYILNTETFTWRRAVTVGNPPSARDSHSCSAWMNKIVVIGGQDEHERYLSDVHILDTDTLIWKKLHTSGGQKLTARAGHVTVSFGRWCYVFGGLSEAQNLYNDLYSLDIHTGVWTQIVTLGEAPCPRFSSAGAFLGPHRASSLVIVGGCNKKLEALDDMFYLNTGVICGRRFDQNVGSSLPLNKQLKKQCQQQIQPSSSVPKTPVRLDLDHQVGRGGSGLSTSQLGEERMKFQAHISEGNQVGYTMETRINGRVLRGVLFKNNHSSGVATDQRKRPAISDGHQNKRSKRPRINDQAMRSKGSSSNCVEAAIGTINNPLDVDADTVAVAVAPQQETVTVVVTSDGKDQDATQVNMDTVNTAPSSIPQADKGAKSGPGEA